LSAATRLWVTRLLAATSLRSGALPLATTLPTVTLRGAIPGLSMIVQTRLL
jgi:hypothetical protein